MDNILFLFLIPLLAKTESQPFPELTIDRFFFLVFFYSFPKHQSQRPNKLMNGTRGDKHLQVDS